MTGAQEKVREWSTRFRQCPLAAEVVTGLDKRASEIWRRTFDLLQQESPEYRNAVDEQFTFESQAHCKELLHTIVSIAAGRRPRTGADPFAFVRAHAEWRARHQVPLVASLHAYRLAHKTYGGITRELLLQRSERDQALLALAMLSDFWIEFFDHIGFVLADAHAAELGQSVAKNTRAYTALIENLLRGIEPTDSEACRLRTMCGIRPGAPMAVAVARVMGPANGNPIDVEPALRSLERLLQQEVPSSTFGKLVTMRDGEVHALICSQANPSRGLVKLLKRRDSGRRIDAVSGVGIGVSRDAAEVSQLPKALEEARLALEFVTPTHPILRFDDIELTEFLIRRAEGSAFRLIPEWANRLAAPEGPQWRELAKTIRAFADCSLNVKETARRLNLHPNTVYFRLNQIQNLTGTNPRTFAGLSLLLTALRLLDSQQQGKPAGA